MSERIMRFRKKFPCWIRYNRYFRLNEKRPGLIGPDCDTWNKFCSVIDDLLEEEIKRCTLGGHNMTPTGFKWGRRSRLKPLQKDNLFVKLEMTLEVAGGLAAARMGAAEIVAAYRAAPEPEEYADFAADLQDDDARSTTSKGSASSNASSLSTGTPRLSLGGRGVANGQTRLPLPAAAAIPAPMSQHAPFAIPARETCGMSVDAEDDAFVKALYGTESTVAIASTMRVGLLKDAEPRYKVAAERFFDKYERELAATRALYWKTVSEEEALERGCRIIEKAWGCNVRDDDVK